MQSSVRVMALDVAVGNQDVYTSPVLHLPDVAKRVIVIKATSPSGATPTTGVKLLAQARFSPDGENWSEWAMNLPLEHPGTLDSEGVLISPPDIALHPPFVQYRAIGQIGNAADTLFSAWMVAA